MFLLLLTQATIGLMSPKKIGFNFQFIRPRFYYWHGASSSGDIKKVWINNQIFSDQFYLSECIARCHASSNKIILLYKKKEITWPLYSTLDLRNKKIIKNKVKPYIILVKQ